MELADGGAADESDGMALEAEVEATVGSGDGQVMYRAVKAGVIREGADMGSAKVGKLAEGEVFEALEEVTGAGGQRRALGRR